MKTENNKSQTGKSYKKNFQRNVFLQKNTKMARRMASLAEEMPKAS